MVIKHLKWEYKKYFFLVVTSDNPLIKYHFRCFHKTFLAINHGPIFWQIKSQMMSHCLPLNSAFWIVEITWDPCSNSPPQSYPFTRSL